MSSTCFSCPESALSLQLPAASDGRCWQPSPEVPKQGNDGSNKNSNSNSNNNINSNGNSKNNSDNNSNSNSNGNSDSNSTAIVMLIVTVIVILIVIAAGRVSRCIAAAAEVCIASCSWLTMYGTLVSAHDSTGIVFCAVVSHPSRNTTQARRGYEQP